MTLRTIAACDNATCDITMQIPSRVDAANTVLDQAGWTVLLTSMQSTITGGRLGITRHYCSTACVTAGKAAQRAAEARELVRR